MIIQRNTCMVTGKEDLEHLYTLKSFPMLAMPTTTDPSEDILCDMSWYISKNRGIVQLNPLIELDVLYNQVSHGAGTQGGIWKKHSQEFTDFVASFGPKHILEIGGGNGIIAETYLDKNEEATWRIVDPACTASPKGRLSVDTAFFDDGYRCDQEIDAMVHSHTFEHIYDPVSFLRQIHAFLQDGDYHIFTLPNLEAWLKNKYPNALLFEHPILLTESIIDELLQSCGFKVVVKKYFGEHSIFYATVRVPEGKPPDKYQKLRHDTDYELNSCLYLDFVRYYAHLAASINRQLEGFEGELYVFGAHVFTQTLLAFGLDSSKILGVIDNDPNKHGKRLYGTKLKIFPVDILETYAKPGLILHAGVYTEEIKTQVLSLVSSLVIF